MPPEPLLRPDNRQLASGTGDVSTFGAQPEAAVSYLGPANPGAQPPAIAEPTPPASAPDSAAEPGHRPDFEAAALDNTGATPSGGSQPHPAPSENAPSQDASDSSIGAPEPAGGGTPPDLLTQPPASPADGSTVGSSASPVADGAVGQAFALISPIVGADAVLSPVVAQIASVDNALEGVTGRLDGVTSNLTDALERPADVLGDTADGLAGALDAAGANPATQIAGLADAASLGPTYDLDSLTFSGSDPAAGIGTLVDMVQTSELFTVGQAETPAAAPDASGSIVDSLIDGGAEVPVLGEDTHDDNPIDDDLGLGL